MRSVYTLLPGNKGQAIAVPNRIVRSVLPLLFVLFSLAASAQTISSVTAASPGSGTDSYVGNTITVSGTNLGGVTIVKVGSTSVTSFTAAASQITFTAPNASGAVYVEGPDGNFTSSASINNLGYRNIANTVWQTTSSWLGGVVPPNGSDVTLAFGMAVPYDVGTFNKLTIAGGAIVNIGNGGRLNAAGTTINNGTININNNGDLYISGSLTNNGAIYANASSKVYLAEGGSMTGNSIGYNQTTSTLFVNYTSGYTFTGSEPFWPSANGPVTVTFNGASTIPAGISKTANNVTINAATLTLGADNSLTVNGTLTVNSTSALVSGAYPTYGSSSTLALAPGGSYTIGTTNKVWGPGSSGPGVPYKVTTSGSTITLSGDRTAQTSFINGSGNIFTNNTNTLTVAPAVTAAATALTNNGIFSNGGGNIVVGPTGGGNQGMSIAGTFTFSAGTVTVNGNLIHTSGAFNQSGGTFYVDGNGASSVASGTPLVQLNNVTLNMNGGTFVIVDPHAGSNATTDLALTASMSGAENNAATHTFQFGNGVSTAAGGNSNGFGFDVTKGTSKLAFGKLVINTGSGTNRHVTPITYFGVRSDLTITSNELVLGGTATMTVGGNLANAGTLTDGAGVALAMLSGTTVSAATTAQTVSGSGTFRNSASNSTGAFTSLTTNNTAGVGFSIPLSLASLSLTSGILTLSSDLSVSSISGGSSTAYVKTSGGALTIRNTNSATFPVGNSTYNPVTLSGGPAQDWTVSVSDAVSNVTGIYAANVSKAVSRQWNITPATYMPVPAPGVTATFYYNGTTDVGASFSNAVDMQVWHYDGPQGWAQRGGAVTPSTVNGMKAVSASGLTYFSPFALSNVGAPLPVKMLTFSGKRNGNNNELRWVTLTEENNRGFSVERSLDGRNYTSAGFVGSLANGGNGAGELSYSYTDVNPSGRKWYYRLKQTDLDGRSKYSAVVSINGDKSDVLLVDGVYPNPAKDALQVRVQAGATNGNIILQLTDMTGKVVKVKSINTAAGASTTVALDLNGLASGVYHLKAVSEGEVSEVVKVVKN